MALATTTTPPPLWAQLLEAEVLWERWAQHRPVDVCWRLGEAKGRGLDAAGGAGPFPTPLEVPVPLSNPQPLGRRCRIQPAPGLDPGPSEPLLASSPALRLVLLQLGGA